jgi:NADPH:quinone reductase
MLKSELGAEHIFCSQDPEFGKKMKEACKSLQATVCLECIAGDTVGEMLSYMGFGSTLILYGALSHAPAGNISPLHFLGLNQTMESFLMPYYMKELPD